MINQRPRSVSALSSSSRGKPPMRTLYKDKKSKAILMISDSLQKQNKTNDLQQEDIKKQPTIKIRPLSARPSQHSHQQRPHSQQSRRFINSSLQPTNDQIFKDKDKDQQFRQTTLKLTKQLLKYHDPELCVCAQCICGRHLCKFHPAAPNLTKMSTYDRDYYPKTNSIPNKIFIATQTKSGDFPNLQPMTTYYKDYPQKKNDDLSRPKPQDLLKTGGPSPNLTTYASDFPGYRGPNQYVKPTDKYRRDKFPLRGRTTYNTSFLGKPPIKNEFDRIPDNLKTGTNWFGQTTYNNFFKSPNPQCYATPQKRTQRFDQSPNDKNQFKTSYGKDFLNPGNHACPAIQALARKSRISHKSKLNFTDNFNFKGMSNVF